MSSPLLQNFDPQTTLLWGLSGADVPVAPPALGSISMATSVVPLQSVARRLALSAVDPGNRMPDGGYMQPLLTPAPLKRGAPNATMVLGAWDKAPERARAVLTRLWRNKRLRTAVDDNAYDEFAARVGLRRVAGETNDDLRTRIVATLAHGPDAATLPGLAALLATTYSIPVSTMDGPGGSYVVYATFSRYDGRLQAAPALIRDVKAAGIQVITRAFAPSAAVSDTVGTFAVGELALGAGDLLITIG